ncbi:unnamed protein product [Rangifer tarandus platyrhynchus]|uniref:Uncharacterized protein n=1 Tax=Rangifer tarandus platyrhynchus TaxID=3082113 RepID=A0ABN8XU04_RANTA|nr:unnamed protein product [Rangifer tarandus platyrhynchus]
MGLDTNPAKNGHVSHSQEGEARLRVGQAECEQGQLKAWRAPGKVESALERDEPRLGLELGSPSPTLKAGRPIMKSAGLVGEIPEQNEKRRPPDLWLMGCPENTAQSSILSSRNEADKLSEQVFRDLAERASLVSKVKLHDLIGPLCPVSTPPCDLGCSSRAFLSRAISLLLTRRENGFSAQESGNHGDGITKAQEKREAAKVDFELKMASRKNTQKKPENMSLNLAFIVCLLGDGSISSPVLTLIEQVQKREEEEVSTLRQAKLTSSTPKERGIKGKFDALHPEWRPAGGTNQTHGFNARTAESELQERSTAD